LINFLNIDSLNIEFERLKSEDDYFPKRDDFRHKIADVISNSEAECSLFCIGLRNIQEYVKKYIQLEGRAYIDEAFKCGRGAIFMGTHAGNWEISNAALGLLGIPYTIVAETPMIGMSKPYA